MQPLKKQYRRIIAWGRTERALATISFAESSFFPIPPDPILINMTLEHPKRWLRLAAITTIMSILGGILGYIIGFALFESVGTWLIETYHLQHRYEQLGELFRDNGLITIFAAALTPIPYKIFTITAGAFSLNIATFLFASVLGRGMRFFAVAAASSFLGRRYRDKIERYIDLISLAILVLVILAVLVISKL